MKNKRIIIHPNDIMSLYGFSYSTAIRLMKKIKKHYKKEKHQKITIAEFCRHEGLSIEEMREVLGY